MEHYTKPKRKINKKFVAIGIGGICLVIGIIAGTLISTHQTSIDINSKEVAKAPLDLKALMNLSANPAATGSTEAKTPTPKAKPVKVKAAPQIKTIAPTPKVTPKPKPEAKPTPQKESSGGFFSKLLHKTPKVANTALPKTANVEHSNLSFQILTNQIILKPEDVQNIEIQPIGSSGYGIQINLTDAASNRLESFTESHLNKPCQFVINDTIISLSLIRSAIGTSFVIPAENKAKAEKIYHLLVS